jgi:indole-3-glycerol phosphate synthase
LTILEKIFETKRREVEAAKSVVSPTELEDQARQISKRRNFEMALRESNFTPALIAEVKRASPSQGKIVVGDFDPVGIAKIYEESGAACLSVLTDVEYFQGSPEYLRQIRKAVNLPLLRKDFIFDEYQLDEAIVWGADCVLLIVAGLEPSNLHQLYCEAKRRNLQVLVEVHNEAEMVVALELEPEMIGINNRDLATFETDIVTTERLIEMVPALTLTVSESAIHTRQDVELVESFGASAVLVGTAFCGSDDIGAKVREVMGA